MNAMTPSAPQADMPAADAPFVSVRVNRARYRVYHTLGRCYWISRVEACGYVWPGRALDEVAEGSDHALAVSIAQALLRGIGHSDAAGIAVNDDAAPPMPFWRWAAGSLAFAASAMVLMWCVIIIGWALRGDR